MARREGSFNDAIHRRPSRANTPGCADESLINARGIARDGKGDRSSMQGGSPVMARGIARDGKEDRTRWQGGSHAMARGIARDGKEDRP
jgi:hypothetical protein